MGLFILFAIISIFALRHNNLTMISLRDDLYAADKKGQGVEQALADLRTYVYGHMNTNLSSGGNAIKPPIQLKYTYERLQAAQQKSTNAGLYTEAENYCQKKIPASVSFYGAGRISCVTSYIETHGNQPAKIKTIPPALYQYDFVSPSWSPDLAGWSLVAAAVFFIAFIAKFATARLLRDS